MLGILTETGVEISVPNTTDRVLMVRMMEKIRNSLETRMDAGFNADTLSAGSLEMVQDELTDGSLLSPCGTSVRVDQGYYLCYRPDRLDLPAFVAFREWILEEGAKSRGADA
jgi:DNA-binding transcriptional LysR family regulator